jgi:hypothetical protein
VHHLTFDPPKGGRGNLRRRKVSHGLITDLLIEARKANDQI